MMLAYLVRLAYIQLLPSTFQHDSLGNFSESHNCWASNYDIDVSLSESSAYYSNSVDLIAMVFYDMEVHSEGSDRVLRQIDSFYLADGVFLLWYCGR